MIRWSSILVTPCYTLDPFDSDARGSSFLVGIDESLKGTTPVATIMFLGSPIAQGCPTRVVSMGVV